MTQKVKLFLFIISCLPIFCNAYNVQKDSVLFDILLSNEMLKPLNNISFINSIDIIPEEFILISSPNQFYLLGMGEIIPLSEKFKESVNSFTQTPDSALMFVYGKNLCYLDSLGKPAKLFSLPNKGMRIKSGTEVIYLYDCDNKQDKYGIYVLFKGTEYLTLLEYPSPITSVLETGKYLLFSSKNKLFSVNIENKEVTELLELPDKNEKIVSITKDAAKNVIYLSSNQFVYRIINKTIECINEQFGGILHYDGEGLLVFVPDKNFIVRLRNNVLYQ
jgi:hypothetical protein